MTIQECYQKLEGNYDEVFGRFRSEQMVQRFAKKYLQDGSYQMLVEAIEQGNIEEAFREAHTLKGVCNNLSFTRLSVSSSHMAELLRAGDMEAGKQYLNVVSKDHYITVTALEELDA